ncbi:DNA/RNA non-specific endonuclease [Nodosilinea sp. LEGE 07088]|uniref:DNA/RNA non-specific endonuclease n=1 Tax=Nodosilinea sp. LEGE 07088 TaxID=2777968 RepID=UPI0018828646|nr:DNA/RNA non-specific endonuclease [Nodosilinea sp. LEGE 07088]MBE9138125.1 DNA/RNA non-specific endonuclease [Nodosilinea sp. LEGE 07088]
MTNFLTQVWIRCLLLLALGAGLTGCGDLVMRLAAWSTPVDLSALPPCVDDDCNCGDFATQAQAQVVLEAFRGDPYGLDGDGNDRACELLPAAPLPADPPAPPSSNPHLVLGNPSQAAAVNPNNYLIQRHQYALSYNRDRNGLNWASWEVDAAWLGQVNRQNDFRPDGALPRGFYQVTPNDYRGSGYDRGHVVPSGDRTRTIGDNSATFLMTNIIPQAAANNRGPWRELEEYTRDLVYQYDHSLHVLAGAYGTQGSVGNRAIAVPSRLWKIIVVYDRLADGGLGIGSDTKVIAVDMPNSDQIDPDWRRYQTSVQRLEIATGYRFMDNLPLELQTALKAQTSSIP